MTEWLNWYIYIYIYMCVCVCVCVCCVVVYIYVCVCVYVCVYIYIGLESSPEEGNGWKTPGKENTYSSILAWRIPSTEDLGRLQLTGSQGIRHNWAAKQYIIFRGVEKHFVALVHIKKIKQNLLNLSYLRLGNKRVLIFTHPLYILYILYAHKAKNQNIVNLKWYMNRQSLSK